MSDTLIGPVSTPGSTLQTPETFTKSSDQEMTFEQKTKQVLELEHLEARVNNLISWAQINLGNEILGTISTAERQPFLETYFSKPQWKEVVNLSTTLVAMIEQLFELGEDVIQSRIRYVQTSFGVLQVQVHLGAIGLGCPDATKLSQALAHFSQSLVMTADMHDVAINAILPPIEEAAVLQAADGFLRSCGGKPLGQSIQLAVGHNAVSTISGVWRTGGSKLDRQELPEETIEALYDGRRLRSRTLFVLAASPRTRTYQIFYDEEKFDAHLRELRDDKMIMLSIVVKPYMNDKQQISYDLVSLHRIDVPSELTLA